MLFEGKAREILVGQLCPAIRHIRHSDVAIEGDHVFFEQDVMVLPLQPNWICRTRAETDAFSGQSCLCPLPIRGVNSEIFRHGKGIVFNHKPPTHHGGEMESIVEVSIFDAKEPRAAILLVKVKAGIITRVEKRPTAGRSNAAQCKARCNLPHAPGLRPRADDELNAARQSPRPRSQAFYAFSKCLR